MDDFCLFCYNDFMCDICEYGYLAAGDQTAEGDGFVLDQTADNLTDEFYLLDNILSGCYIDVLSADDF